MNKQMSRRIPSLSTSILFGGLVTTVLGAAIAKESGLLASADAKRVIGVAFGIILMLAGNMLPKLVLPLKARSGNPALKLAADRMAGLTFTLAGIAYMSIWIFAPSQSAMLISSIVGLGALVFVSAAYLWLLSR